MEDNLQIGRFDNLFPSENLAQIVFNKIKTNPEKYLEGILVLSETTSPYYCAGIIRSNISNALLNGNGEYNKEVLKKINIYAGDVPKDFKGKYINLDNYLRSYKK